VHTMSALPPRRGTDFVLSQGCPGSYGSSKREGSASSDPSRSCRIMQRLLLHIRVAVDVHTTICPKPEKVDGSVSLTHVTSSWKGLIRQSEWVLLDESGPVGAEWRNCEGRGRGTRGRGMRERRPTDISISIPCLPYGPYLNMEGSHKYTVQGTDFGRQKAANTGQHCEGSERGLLRCFVSVSAGSTS